MSDINNTNRPEQIDRSIGFIGMGNMGIAILKGLKPLSNNDEITIYAFDKNEKAKEAVNNYDVTWLYSERELSKKCSFIILAVKPQNVLEVLTEISPELNDKSVIISICAGVSIELIKKLTTDTQKVVRVMPNLSSTLGEGASAYSVSDDLSKGESEFAHLIIQSFSKALVDIPEIQMNAMTAINGSSPGFILEIARYFVNFAESEGIDKKKALTLFGQTLIGCGKLIEDRGFEISSLETLIGNISSKGGTTIAGLESFRKNNLCEVIGNGCKACKNRAFELGNELEKGLKR